MIIVKQRLVEQSKVWVIGKVSSQTDLQHIQNDVWNLEAGNNSRAQTADHGMAEEQRSINPTGKKERDVGNMLSRIQGSLRTMSEPRSE